MLPIGLAVGVDWAATTVLVAVPDPPAPKDNGDNNAAIADPGSIFDATAAGAATGAATGAGTTGGGCS